MSKTNRVITMYTDGSCEDNGSPDAVGGWSAVLDNGNKQLRVSGGKFDITPTSSRMEIQAVIEGLKAVKRKEATIQVHTDSAYVKKGASQWLKEWKAKDWKGSNGKPVKNQDLWITIDDLLQELPFVTFHKVKGHSGNSMNDLADKLASAARGKDLKRSRHPSGASA